MKTRFDCKTEWVTSDGLAIRLSDMETTHLMNIIGMFIKKPFITASMIIRDIERQEVCTASKAWKPNAKKDADVKKESIYNVTSMTEESLVDYALNSPLGLAILEELRKRGVNTKNIVEMMLHEKETNKKE